MIGFGNPAAAKVAGQRADRRNQAERDRDREVEVEMRERDGVESFVRQPTGLRVEALEQVDAGTSRSPPLQPRRTIQIPPVQRTQAGRQGSGPLADGLTPNTVVTTPGGRSSVRHASVLRKTSMHDLADSLRATRNRLKSRSSPHLLNSRFAAHTGTRRYTHVGALNTNDDGSGGDGTEATGAIGPTPDVLSMPDMHPLATADRVTSADTILWHRDTVKGMMWRHRQQHLAYTQLVGYAVYLGLLITLLYTQSMPDEMYATGGFLKDTLVNKNALASVRTFADIWKYIDTRILPFVLNASNNNQPSVTDKAQIVDGIYISQRRSKWVDCASLYTNRDALASGSYNKGKCPLPLSEGDNWDDYWYGWNSPYKVPNKPTHEINAITWGSRENMIALKDILFNIEEPRSLTNTTLPSIELVNAVYEFTFEAASNQESVGFGEAGTWDGTCAAGPSMAAGFGGGDGAVAIPTGCYFDVTHGLSNDAEYTMLFDIKLPSDVTDTTPLINTDTSYTDHSQIFATSAYSSPYLAIGSDRNGLGWSPQYQLTPQTWHRVVVIHSADHLFDMYLDGTRLPRSSTNVPTTGDATAMQATNVLLFADGTGNDGAVDVSTVAIYDGALTPSEAQALGKPGDPLYYDKWFPPCPYFTAGDDTTKEERAFSIIIAPDYLSQFGLHGVKEVLSMAQRCEFLDMQTRILNIEVNTYIGAEHPIVVMCWIQFEVSITGEISTSYQLSVLNVDLTFDNTTRGKKLKSLMTTLIVIQTMGMLYFLMDLFGRIGFGGCHQGVKYMTNYWTIHSITHYVLFFIMISYLQELNDSVENLDPDNWKLFRASMAEASEVQNKLRIVQALVIVFAITKVLSFLQYRGKLSVLSATMMRVGSELAHFLVTLGIVLISFIFMAWVVFGPALSEFSTYENSTATLGGFIFGDFSFQNLRDYDDGAAWTLFWAFMLICAVILMNFFVAIVLDGYTSVTSMTDRNTTIMKELKDFLWANLDFWLPCYTSSDVLFAIDRPPLKHKTTVSLLDIMNTVNSRISHDCRSALLHMCREDDQRDIVRSIKGDPDYTMTVPLQKSLPSGARTFLFTLVLVRFCVARSKKLYILFKAKEPRVHAESREMAALTKHRNPSNEEPEKKHENDRGVGSVLDPASIEELREISEHMLDVHQHIAEVLQRVSQDDGTTSPDTMPVL